MKERDDTKEFTKAISELADHKFETKFNTKQVELTKEAQKVAQQAVKEEIDIAKKDMFIIFGIFASIVTFVVGGITIFSNVKNLYEKIGISFLFVSIMQGFLFGIMFLIDKELCENKYKKMWLVFFMFFVIGISFLIIPNL